MTAAYVLSTPLAALVAGFLAVLVWPSWEAAMVAFIAGHLWPYLWGRE